MAISNLNNDDYDRGWMDGRDSMEPQMEALLEKVDAVLLAWRTNSNTVHQMSALRNQVLEINR